MTWSRLINKTTASCICYKIKQNKETQFCDGFNDTTIEMGVDSNNIVFLTMKRVHLSDSGIYFCDFYNGGKSTYDVIQLNVEGSNETQHVMNTECKSREETQDDLNTESKTEWNKPKETTYVMSLTLGGLTVFLLVVVTVLVVSLIKLQAASGEKQDPQQNENVDCDDLKAAALSVFSPAVRSRRPASQRQVETHVTYAASR
ncbi:uncharacterized protein LOC114851345 isoform X2 [Betta splendens]|uniref:Uncharacterized protein LOC114851345 isoform X2 n=1 Tax=Betta splendens TaxID=158456 RepID=A0A6P7LXE1_BETSP|nr:uncharacterized protein LOC114851345 isoform X2 [Betta splendens]